MPRLDFEHLIFNELYTRDFFIADTVLRDILALEPGVAVPELLKITELGLRLNPRRFGAGLRLSGVKPGNN